MALLALPLLAAPKAVQNQRAPVTFQVLVVPQNAEGPPGCPGPVTFSMGGEPAPLLLCHHFVVVTWNLCGIPQHVFPPTILPKEPYFLNSRNLGNKLQQYIFVWYVL